MGHFSSCLQKKTCSPRYSPNTAILKFQNYENWKLQNKPFNKAFFIIARYEILFFLKKIKKLLNYILK